jgi:hypothetical protein
LWITCNPDNWPSRKTCEYLGATLVEVVDLPKESALYQRGERQNVAIAGLFTDRLGECPSR